MGKNDFLTPKAIGNRIKSKGLQKLRWYCQMCQKQCRDENGFKCHLTSDSHKRQMMVFGEAPTRVIEGYSEQFQEQFMENLRRSHPFSRVAAKVVYNEYIADKHHVHMNSTKWLTLTEFVKYLGREGLCKVEDMEKGWYITIIQKDPVKELGEETRRKRDRAERDEEERLQRDIEAQVERAQKAARQGEGEENEAAAGPGSSELHRGKDEQPLAFSLASKSHLAPAAIKPPVPRFADTAFREDKELNGRGGASQPDTCKARQKSKLEELMAQDQAGQAAKAKSERTAYWLMEGIQVKVLSKELREAGYYKAKGRVRRVLKQRVAELEMAESGDVIQVDQAQLETVLPQPGGAVKVLQGTHRGAAAVLVKVDVSKFQAQVQIKGGAHNGKQLWLEYEDVCKVPSS